MSLRDHQYQEFKKKKKKVQRRDPYGLTTLTVTLPKRIEKGAMCVCARFLSKEGGESQAV